MMSDNICSKTLSTFPGGGGASALIAHVLKSSSAPPETLPVTGKVREERQGREMGEGFASG